MATVTADLGSGPRVPYKTLVERVTPHLHNRLPEGFLIDTVRDAVIQVCRDLDFLRHTFEFYKNEDPNDRDYTMVHQGYSLANPHLAWVEEKDPRNILPIQVFNDMDLFVNRTVLHLPRMLSEMVRRKLIVMVTLQMTRDSLDFPIAVYEQEAQLLILKARSLLRDFDRNPVPEQAYLKEVGKAKTRYLSSAGNERTGMYI